MEQKTNNKKYKYYEIKVSIRDTHPPVWRRLQIPEGITFHELNAIIQLAFDWCGYHAYNFEVGATLHEEGVFIELPELDDGWGYYETKNSKKEKIDKYFKEFKAEIENCEFVGCTHIKEQNCGIKEAIEEGKVTKERYDRYVKIYNELKNKEARRW